MTMDHRYHHLDGVRSAFSVVLYPIQYVMTLPGNFAAWLGESVSTREALQAENEALRRRQLLQQQQLQRYAALQAENARLRALLDASRRVEQKVLIAELLSVDVEPYSRSVVLNKGSEHGIYAGQPILDANGVMGQVTRVGPYTSTALLITDPSHAIPVLVNRSGQRAIAVGTGPSDKLELPYLPNTADIKPGDLLVTSGLGGRFPPGYPVARVETVHRSPTEPYVAVLAQPLAQVQRAREVLLVRSEPAPAAPAADCTPGVPGCPPAPTPAKPGA